jgi:hypothetical protein
MVMRASGIEFKLFLAILVGGLAIILEEVVVEGILEAGILGVFGSSLGMALILAETETVIQEVAGAEIFLEEGEGVEDKMGQLTRGGRFNFRLLT